MAAFGAVTILMDTLHQHFLQPTPLFPLRNKTKVKLLYRNLSSLQCSLEKDLGFRVGEYDEAMKGLEAQLRDVSVELRFQIEHQLRLFYLGKSMKLRLHSAQKLLPILKEAIKGGIETMDFNSVMEILGKHFTLPVSGMPPHIYKRVKSFCKQHQLFLYGEQYEERTRYVEESEDDDEQESKNGQQIDDDEQESKNEQQIDDDDDKECRLLLKIITLVWRVSSQIKKKLKNAYHQSNNSQNNNPASLRGLELDNIQSKVCKRLSPEFEKIGREIVEKCKGLPLAIIVTAGLLSNSNQTFIHEWEHIAKCVPALSLDHSNQQGENIINLSYTFLPHHLKLCFLSFGCFPEDDIIYESRIVDIWDSEGFLKVLKSESLKDVARKNLQDLVDRNLVLFNQYRNGVKFYQMHDVLRELVLREVRKENLLCSKKGYTISLRWKRNESINSSHISQPWSVQSRICSYNSITPTNNTSSLMDGINTSIGVGVHAQFKFLRVFAVISEVINVHNIFLKIVGLVHLRYLFISCGLNIHYLPLFMLRNLQKLEVGVYSSCEPLDIWGLPQLKDINIPGTITLVPPRSVHHNLESIRCLDYRSCTKELFLRIPNLRTLEVTTNPKIKCKAPSWFESLVYLYKLEVLMVDAELEEFSTIYSKGMLSLENILPNLKVLNLFNTNLKWKDMDVVGKLSKLEDLRLMSYAVKDRKWKPKDGGFRRLRFLYIYSRTLQYWEATSNHFPVLEKLDLTNIKLKEIPSDFAEIATLKSIKLSGCLESLISSAERIQEEQQQYGNDTFAVHISWLDFMLP
nr:putative disease resistance RPP13-like protein 3 [Ipomoea batatas]